MVITTADKLLQLQVQSIKPTTCCHAGEHWYNITYRFTSML